MTKTTEMLLLGIYLTGLTYHGVKNLIIWPTIKEIPHLKKRMSSYLILKPLFWPVYAVTEHNPIHFIGWFFRHYGKPGVTHLRERGFKFFLNDLMKGKNRYKHHKTFQMVIKLPRECDFLRELPESIRKRDILHLAIAFRDNQYLLYKVMADADLSMSSLTRFDLDDAHKLNRQGFLKKIDKYGDFNRDKILEQLNELIKDEN